MSRPDEYEAMQRVDVQSAFKRAYLEIEAAQKALREKDPESPLLNLIYLHEDGDGLNFHKNFGAFTLEHSPHPPKETGWYYAMGIYVDILEGELSDPLYNKAR